MRLTKDLKTPHDDTTYADELINVVDKENIVLTKLKHYENIEDELGIDLITLVKALKNGTYIPFYGQVIPLERYKLDLPNKRFVDKRFNGNEWEDTLYFKDYGKTWALTKEELL